MYGYWKHRTSCLWTGVTLTALLLEHSVHVLFNFTVVNQYTPSATRWNAIPWRQNALKTAALSLSAIWWNTRKNYRSFTRLENQNKLSPPPPPPIPQPPREWHIRFSMCMTSILDFLGFSNISVLFIVKYIAECYHISTVYNIMPNICLVNTCGNKRNHV